MATQRSQTVGVSAVGVILQAIVLGRMMFSPDVPWDDVGGAAAAAGIVQFLFVIWRRLRAQGDHATAASVVDAIVDAATGETAIETKVETKADPSKAAGLVMLIGIGLSLGACAPTHFKGDLLFRAHGTGPCTVSVTERSSGRLVHDYTVPGRCVLVTDLVQP